MSQLRKTFTNGTHRLFPPEATWRRIRPHLAAAGITRCADITGLDRLGIPVACAIRPQGRLLQVSNGKGLRQIDANVSACMEAIEHHHAEVRACAVVRGSWRQMVAEGRWAIRPHDLPALRAGVFYSDDYIFDWIEAEELLSGESAWLPAQAAYFCPPATQEWSTNGLASGNHLVEATLHALYELIERETISGLSARGAMTFSPRTCRFIHLAALPQSPLRDLCSRLQRAEIRPVLIWVRNRFSVHTFMAVLLDQRPFASSSMVNVGYGAHLCPMIAAIRAITEAAQSRLTFIHGAREDMPAEAYQEFARELYRFFAKIPARARSSALPDNAHADFSRDQERVLASLSRAGFKRVFRVNMTRPPFHLPVVKCFVPGMRMNRSFF